MKIDSPFAALGNIADTGEVQAQVQQIVRRFAPGHDLSRIDAVFALLDRTLAGDLPGYHRLQTLYHNRSHTNEVVLCAARMLHGLHLGGQGLDSDHIDAALIGALMHDIGYVMTDAEAAIKESSGAQFTDTHVMRGVEFVRTHLVDLPEDVLDTTIKVIQVTDHRKHPDWVKFATPMQQRAAYATATADLVGQMANRAYLERLLYLYVEFEEAQIGGFADFHDLLEKTTSFYRIMKGRMDKDLDAMSAHLTRHFAATGGEQRNFYLESIERNLSYLDHIVREQRERRFELLKRGHVVEKILELKGKP